MTITVIVTLTAKKNHETDLIQLVNESRVKATKNKDCSEFLVRTNQDDASEIVMIESWSSRESHTKFVEALMEDEQVTASLGDFSVDGPQISYYQNA